MFTFPISTFASGQIRYSLIIFEILNIASVTPDGAGPKSNKEFLLSLLKTSILVYHVVLLILGFLLSW